MLRTIMAVFYVLIGPAVFAANSPDRNATISLCLVSGLAGLWVARVHWRQTTGSGRFAVAIGTLFGAMLGGGTWAAGMLLLAFASDSGEYADALTKMMLALTYSLLLLAAPLGALAGSGIRASLAKKPSAIASNQAENTPTTEA